MTKMIGIYDGSTNEQITREMTVEELANYELGATAQSNRETEIATLKQEQLSILAGLGLTEQQAIILGLIPKPMVAINE